MLQDQLERQLRRGESEKKSDLQSSKWHHSYRPWKLIDRYLRAYIDKPYSEFYNKIITKLKKEDYYKIDQTIYRKNINGEFIDSYGRVHDIPKYTVKTTGFTGWKYYYVENGILKYFKPYRRFSKEKQRKIIKKKEPKIDPLFKFDYVVKFIFNTESIHTSTSEDGKSQFTNFTVKEFKNWCEQRKKTYNISEKGFKFTRNKGKLEIINLPEKIHIKTNYK